LPNETRNERGRLRLAIELKKGEGYHDLMSFIAILGGLMIYSFRDSRKGAAAS